MIPYGRQSVDKSDSVAVLKTLQSPWLTQGPQVLAFEKALAKTGGAKYAVAVANGTAALHLSYLVAGLKTGDEVITTPNTFVATTNMLLAVGAKPVFCDIRSDTYNIDETKIEKLITKRTRAIVPVHFAGHPCDLGKIKSIAKKYKLLVIEDACHALGASFNNKKIGSIGDMSIFSFHPVKPITTGEGGAILTNNKKFYEQLVLLRSHGVKKDQKGFNVMTELGYNYRLTDIQAALGISQLKKLDRFIKQRHWLVEWYKKCLADCKDIVLPIEAPRTYSAWHIYVIRTRESTNRLPLYNHLKIHGISANFHYPTVYSHPYYRKNGFAKIHCPIAEEYTATTITLPLYTLLTSREVLFVTKTVKDFFQK